MRFALATAVLLLAAPLSAQTLRVGLPASDVGSLDPHRATATQDKGAVGWAFSGLVRFPPGSADPGAVVEVFEPGEFRTLLLNTQKPPLDDIRVRRAVAHAVNVDLIVRFVGADVARRGVSPVPPGYLGGITDVATFAPDPARARVLLAEAGHPNGVSIPAVVSNISSQLPIMEQVQAQLRRAGITLDMDIVDHATHHQRIRQDLSGMTFYGAARFPIADSYPTLAPPITEATALRP